MKFNRQLLHGYFKKFYKEILHISYSQRHVNGVEFLITCIENDPEWESLEHISYALASVMHETGHRMEPVEEIIAKPGTDLYNRQKKYMPWTGKGYIQLTHLANFKKMSRVIGVDLVSNPRLALNPKISYEIMAKGLRRGEFTGKKLSDYINNEKKDYRNARRVVNILDKADKIAYYAQCMERILEASIISTPEFKPDVDAVQTQVAELPETKKVDYIEPVIPRITSGLKSWKTAISGVLGSTGLGAAYTWLSEKYQSINNISSVLIALVVVAAAFGIVYFIMREKSKMAREKMAHEITLEQLRIRANPSLDNVEVKQ